MHLDLIQIIGAIGGTGFLGAVGSYLVTRKTVEGKMRDTFLEQAIGRVNELEQRLDESEARCARKMGELLNTERTRCDRELARVKGELEEQIDYLRGQLDEMSEPT